MIGLCIALVYSINLHLQKAFSIFAIPSSYSKLEGREVGAGKMHSPVIYVCSFNQPHLLIAATNMGVSVGVTLFSKAAN